ncbi:MAG TPA: ANTAR domain-containing protein, partial [Bryobacteraceae bacterium]|nr:ANTAR domain-containing protein [Bryobacteraceae bacterium]
TENEVLFRISNIVNGDASFAQAVDQIAALMDSFDPPRRSLYTFVDQQLGLLLIRTQLAERRAQLKREIAQMQEDLATRKLMQRAEGLLIARRAMSQAVAQHWIAQQSQKTGLSKNDVADRIIAYYQATGLSERRIA